MTEFPLISIIIPCRNEEKFIGKCLDSILGNDYPNDKLEVLIIDGLSNDNTGKIITEYSRRYSFIKRIDNPKKITPIAMNLGIQGSKGDVIILVNAHCVLDKFFLKYSIEYLETTKADAVGGRLNTINEGHSLISQTIPLAADSIFGSGGRRYRSRTDEGFVFDTLPYSAYPKEVFKKYGYIDEELIRNQDEEFNYRILKNGGKIYFTPKIKSFLNIRPSLKKLWRQHYQYGYFKPLVAMKVGATMTWRQLIPALFVSALVISGLLSFMAKLSLWLFLLIISSYLFANVIFSLSLAIKKGIRFFFSAPLVFTTLHFSYGIGYLKGMWDFVVMKNHNKKKIEDLPITR